MALKVRDEDDLLEDNFRFHRAQGVDLFVVTDNGSTDRTPEILERYESAGLAHVLREPDAAMHEHGHEWYTRMARLAASEHGADWVVVCDADEFWWPLEGTLRSTLAAVPEPYGVLIGPRAEFVARPDGPGTFAERLVVRERRALLRPKIAFRADPSAVIWHRGGHDVAYVPGDQDLRSALRPPGRAVLRGVREEGEAAGGEPVAAPIFATRILHFPVRSLEQFRRRVEAAVLAAPEGGPRARLRERFESEGAEGLYAELALDDDEVADGVRAGRLVEDTRLRDYLDRCPDPLAGSTDPVAVEALDGGALKGERADLALDTMAALGRHARLNETRLDESRERIGVLLDEAKEARRDTRVERRKALRRRERIRKLEGRLERKREQLRRERRRPWSRLRRALGRAAGRGGS